MLAQYVKQGVDELDAEKLAPLLQLRYKNAIADAFADLGGTTQIRTMFAGFQKYLYKRAEKALTVGLIDGHALSSELNEELQLLNH